MPRKNIDRRALKSAIETLETRKLFALPAELVAVVDGTQNITFGNTQRAIAVYDVSNVRSGTDVFASRPLFSVWTGYEVSDTTRNYEEVLTFTTSNDGGTGYLLANDSGTPGTINTATNDSNGDYDLYKIDIRAAYNDFIANNRPRGIMYMPTRTVDFIPGANQTGVDLVASYGSFPLGPTGLPAVRGPTSGTDINAQQGIHPQRDNTDTNPANDIIWIAGVTSKIGEMAARSGGSGAFFDQQDIQYVNDTTLLVMENTTNSAGATGTGPREQDYSIRTFERLSTTPGQATFTAANATGGFNGQTTESWAAVEWSGDNYIQMDAPITTTDPNTGVVTITGYNVTDVDGMRYVNRDGQPGVWVSDRDGGGDDFTFFGLNFATKTATKLEQRVGASPFSTVFELDEDPVVDASTNDGDVDGFDLDANGNLVIREGSFNDTPVGEPKIIKRIIANYNAGDSDANSVNELTFGAWTTQGPLAPTLDDDAEVTNGLYATVSKAQNAVYYFDIDTGNVADVYVFDLTTGALIYQELNAANNFFTDGNRIRAFTLQPVGDTVAPTVTASAFNFAGTRQSVTVTFSENVSASLAAGDFTLTNLTTGAAIPSSSLSVAYDAATNVATITFNNAGGVGPTVLPTGRYRFAFNSAGIADAAGNALPTTAPLTFGFQNGDFSGNGVVNFDDLLTLARNYNRAGQTFATGDANYDGTINFDDLLVLARNYNQTLAPAPAAPAAPAEAAKRNGRPTSDVLI